MLMSQQELPLFVEKEAESNNTEFKTGSGGRIQKDLWQTISAYSNTEGGKIVFGVTPEGKRISLNRDELDQLQQEIASLCSNAFNVAITPVILCRDEMLIVEIPPVAAPLRPVYSRSKGMYKGTYIRVGSSNYMATEDWIKRTNVAARGGAETAEYEGCNYIDHLDLQLIDSFIGLLSSRRGNLYQSFTREEVLLKQKATNSRGDVTLFGLLAFGKNLSLQELVAPTINIGITQYPGSTKVNEDDLSETYLDNREFNGNALEQFERAFAFIKTKLPIRGTIDSSGKRRDYFVIPEIALREALANAIAHRDYSTHSSRIQIDVYSDRLEIINPGSSLVPIDELDTAPSSTRNPLLMSYLKEHGITDQKARGIRTIKISLKKAGLLEPSFENSSSSFKVTLFGSAFISNRDKQWLMQFSKFDLNERQKNALAHVHNNVSGISNSEYRDINSMNNVRDDKKANKELKQLVELRVLVAVGENKARRYAINPKYAD